LKHVEPIVSVIIPAYNCAAFLPSAIESVLAQSLGAVECIVVDDGSRDATAGVARSYPGVTYIHQENAERSAARNNGLRHARGRYVCFLDADDTLAPEKLAEQAEFLDRHAECVAVYSRVLFFREQSPAELFPLKRSTPAGEILSRLLWGNFLTVHAPLIRREAALEVGGFDPTLSHNEDWEFFLRLALTGPFGFLDRVHAYCRMHEGNTSHDELRMHHGKWQVACHFAAQHERELTLRGIAAAPALAYHEADYGKALISNGSGTEGRRRILNACRQPFPQRPKYLGYALLSLLLGPTFSARLGGGSYRRAKGAK
jgi:glycosyltransferase involved in cell wall biosynthesis